ncbi:hypothetical protein KKD52_12275 [Myxococcota bacterium]|nr:hypothetical protein [Myxococcota bacterium]MBU1410739.1 hypothetical protein [Myxococcota bacterium]MBU1511130.1 hypothetical protein [Myxococcota bacterium]
MLRQFGWLLFWVSLGACDSAEKRITDAGTDRNDLDLVDVPDLTDVSDVSDVQDGPDGETWPAPSCAEDPYLAPVVASYYSTLAAYFPFIYIPMYDDTEKLSTMYAYHVETREMAEIFLVPGYVVGQMVMDIENQHLWFSANERPDFEHPETRLPPKLFIWHMDTQILEDLTDQMYPLRSPACEAGHASLYLQKLDLERNRILFYCTFPDVTRQVGELYFMELTSGERTFLGHYEERYYGRGYPIPELFNEAYFNVYCSDWIGGLESDYKDCYWKVDQPEPALIYESSDGTRINGSTSQVSADHLVYQTWQTETGFDLTATDVRTGQHEILPSLPVFPQGIATAGKLFPRILSWAEGYEELAIGNLLQAGVIGHLFLWDRDTMIYRQVTCKEGNGRYAIVLFMPGDPTGRYGIVGAKTGELYLFFVKDLRAAGIMSEDGQLLPAL